MDSSRASATEGDVISIAYPTEGETVIGRRVELVGWVRGIPRNAGHARMAVRINGRLHSSLSLLPQARSPFKQQLPLEDGKNEIQDLTKKYESQATKLAKAREKEVLRLAADGKTNREMAKILGVSFPTILYWMRKFGIPRRNGKFKKGSQVNVGRKLTLEHREKIGIAGRDEKNPRWN